jgi:type II secretory pathway pseudopilin PulG
VQGREAGFSIIEVLFAVAILGFGVTGILSVLLTGVTAAANSSNSTTGAVEVQTLLARIVSEADASGTHVYLQRIEDPANPTRPANEWIQTTGNLSDPVLADPDPTFPNDQQKAKTDLWWQARVSAYPMDQADPLDSSKDDKTAGTYSPELYQVAIAVYRNLKPGQKKKPLAVYTTLINVQN